MNNKCVYFEHKMSAKQQDQDLIKESLEEARRDFFLFKRERIASNATVWKKCVMIKNMPNMEHFKLLDAISKLLNNDIGLQGILVLHIKKRHTKETGWK